MQEYARQRGLYRLMIPVPVLTPRLSSLWLKLVTPKYSKVGRKLIDGLKNPTVVTSDAARREFAIAPRGLSAAVREAVQHEDNEFAGKRWADFADLEDLPRRYGGKARGHPARRPPPRGGGRAGRAGVCGDRADRRPEWLVCLRLAVDGAGLDGPRSSADPA